MKIFLTLIIFILTTVVFSQRMTDYVILKPKDKLIKPDTIFGQIDLPKNGIILKAKIKTSSGKKKYKIKEVIGFKAGDLYFASLPYSNGYVFAPRLIKGKIDLYFYCTGNGGYTYIYNTGNMYVDLISSIIANATKAAMVNITSYFYIYDYKTNEYYKIPHSENKFKEVIADIFKENPEVYRKIINGDYKPNQIPEIVELYNNSITKYEE